MRRREFIAGLRSAVAWPFAARAQRPALPVAAFINAGTLDTNTRNVGAFHAGLGEIGYLDGQTVTVEFHWLEGRYDRLPALVADLLARRVSVIATPGLSSAPTLMIAKAVGNSIPIVFGIRDDPVKLGLAASLARPGGNATGINFFVNEWRKGSAS